MPGLTPAGFEILTLDPPEPPIVALEARAFEVVGRDWFSRADRVFTSNLGKYRKYKGNSVRDLLRAMRNKVSGKCRRPSCRRAIAPSCDLARCSSLGMRS
jgi:serine/threonine-protein kinase/endoribonuclease IRE1